MAATPKGSSKDCMGLPMLLMLLLQPARLGGVGTSMALQHWSRQRSLSTPSTPIWIWRTVLSSGQDIKKSTVFWLNRIFVQTQEAIYILAKQYLAICTGDFFVVQKKCPVDNAGRPALQDPSITNQLRNPEGQAFGWKGQQR